MYIYCWNVDVDRIGNKMDFVCVCFFTCSLNSLLGLYVYLLRLIWGKASSKSGINYVCIIGKRIVLCYLVACLLRLCMYLEAFVCMSLPLPLPFPVFSLLLHLIRLKSVSFSLSVSPFLWINSSSYYIQYIWSFMCAATRSKTASLFLSLCNVHNCVISSMFWDTVHISK